jgi:solute carrier family 25 protein 33/36
MATSNPPSAVSAFAAPSSQSRELGQVDPATNPSSSKDLASPKERKAWAHFVAGGAGGMTSATLTSPLDVLKTRLQSTFYQTELAARRAAKGIPPPHQLSLPRAALLHITETGQILAAIPKVEGWKALFKGLGPNLVGVVPARAINFWADKRARACTCSRRLRRV